MKPVKLSNDIGYCEHNKENDMCYLTGKECVAIWTNTEGVKSFGQDEMWRCPMYNLDFTRVFGKNLSELIRDYYAEKLMKEQ